MVRFLIGNECRDVESANVTLEANPDGGVSLYAVNANGGYKYAVLSITKTGQLIRHKHVSVRGLSLDDFSRITEKV